MTLPAIPDGIRSAITTYIGSLLDPSGTVRPGDPLWGECERLSTMGLEALLSSDEARQLDFHEQLQAVGDIIRMRHNMAIRASSEAVLLGIAKAALPVLLKMLLPL